MDIPNLFLINKSFPDNHFTIIGMDNNLAVLSTEDMGCFAGDCFCCAEDGSSKPTASLVFKYGKFEYSTTKSTSSFLASEFDNDYPGPHIYYGYIVDQNNGDISGLANASRPGFRSSYQPLQYEKFVLDATNSCGHEQITAYCFWPTCGGGYEIDCTTRKIKVNKVSNYIGTYGFDNETTEEYYDLGDVPSIRVYNDTGCGQPCLFEKEPECLFTKNSLIYEYSNFRDFSHHKIEYRDAGYAQYKFETLSEFTGVSVFNRTLVFPLSISDCSNPNTISSTIPRRVNVGTGIVKFKNIASVKDIYGNYNPYSSFQHTYSVLYYFDFGKIQFEVIDYSGTYGNKHCEDVLLSNPFDQECNYSLVVRNGVTRYTVLSKYLDQPDSSYFNEADYDGDFYQTVPIVCGRTKISKIYLPGSELGDEGQLIAYYDKL